MADDVGQLVVALEARIDKFEKAFARAGQTAARGFTAIENRASQSAEKLESSLARAGDNVNRILAGIGVGISFNEIQKLADTWTEASNRIRAAAAATGTQVRSLQELKAGANEARTSLEDYVDLYSRLIRSASGVAKTEADIAKATSLVSKAFKAGGASASEQASGILQLGQALGSGVLQGDELRSIRENAPILAKAIADAFNVPIAALKSLGEQGKLTSAKVFDAILKAAPDIERQFKATTATIGDSFTRLHNEFTAYVGNLAQSSGATAAFRAIIDGLAGNIGDVSKAAAAAAAVILSRYIPAMIRAGIATAAMVATNPFLLLATAAGGAVYALSAFGDQIKPIQGDLANLQDYAGAAWDVMKEGALQAASTVQNAFHTVIDFIGNAMSSVGTSWADVGSVIKGIANVLVNSFVTAYDLLVATFGKLPGAIAETVLNAMNGLIGAVEAGLNTVIHGVNAAVNAINKVGGKVGVSLGAIGDATLSRIENSYAGAGQAAGEAYSEALSDATKDRVGQALAGINGASDAAMNEWRRRAEERARLRQKEAEAQKAASDAQKAAPTGAAKTMPLEMTKEADEIRKKITLLQAEVAIRKSVAGSIDDIEATIERQKIAQKLVNEATKEGVVWNDSTKAAVGALADAYSKAAQEAKALAKSQEEATQKAKDLDNATRDTMKGFVSDLAHGKSATEALKTALDKISSKLFDMAFNHLWQEAFGKDGKSFKPFTDAFFPTKPDVAKAQGSPLQGINWEPNKTITTPQATVNAGSVTVTGSINPAASSVPSPGGAPGATPNATPSTAPASPAEKVVVEKAISEQAKAAGLPDPFAGKAASTVAPKALTDLPLQLSSPGAAAPAVAASSTGSLSGLSGDRLQAALMGKLMNDLGLSKAQAQGVVGNLAAETGNFRHMQELKPLVPGSRGGYGIAQWTGSRRTEFEEFAKADGRPTNDLNLQYDFLKRELSGQTRGAWTGPGLGGFRAQTDPEAAALYFRRNFERPDPRYAHDETRIRYANQAGDNFDRYGAGPDTTGSITAMKQAQEELQQLQQPIQSIGQSATQVVPNLGGMTQGLTGLVGPLTQAVPGLGQFGGAIQALLAQLMSGFGGGAGLAGGIGGIFGFAEGGTVQGPGTSTSDSIPAMLSKGEYVVNAKAAGKHGHLLEAINTGRVPAFATGGIVGVSNLANSYSPTLNIHVNGAQGGNRLAQQIAGEVGKTLDSNRPDTFRRSEGQVMADTHARLQRYGARNN